MRLYYITLAASLFATILFVELSHHSSADQAQPESSTFTDPSNESSKVFVQTVQKAAMEVYEKLSTMPNSNKDSRLAIFKSTKVRPIAVIEALEDQLEDCASAKMRKNIRNVIRSVRNMFPGGDARLFVVHSNNSVTSELEFVCVTVRAYKIAGEDACDFCMASYVATKSEDTKLTAIGTSAIGVGVAFGAFTLVTGGTGSAALATAAIGLSFGGAAATWNAQDTNIVDTKDLLEASFVYELVSRGHAILDEQNRLYLTNN